MLAYPADPDLFRDISQASAVRRGAFFADAQYGGEIAWYNPLLSWLVASLSWASQMSVSEFTVRAGPILNLVSPIGFVILVRSFFGKRAAGFALVAYLFVICANYPSWAVATYSPWLFTANFAQGLFFFALVQLRCVLSEPSAQRSLVFGAMTGCVFLAHTAPAIILTFVAITAVVLRARRTTTAERSGLVRASAVMSSTAAVVSAPFLLPIALAYQFRIRNSTPSSWTWDAITPERLGHFAIEFVGRWPFLVIFAGGFICLRHGVLSRQSTERTILVAWTVASLTLFSLGTASSSSLPLLPLLPSVVPTSHFLLYLSAALCIWFGVGGAAFLDEVERRSGRRSLPVFAPVLVAILMVLVSLPVWRDRSEVRDEPAIAQAKAVRFEDYSMSALIADVSGPNEIILYDGDDNYGMQLAGLAGRNMVVTTELFSNPYLDWAERRKDAEAMLAALAECDLEGFTAISRPYGIVSLLLVPTPEGVGVSPPGCTGAIDRTAVSQEMSLYRIRP